MADINLITKDDMDTLKYKKMQWDVVVHNTPYQIIKVPGFTHTIGGRLDWGEGNCFWAYPLNEEMTFDNLIEFNGTPGAQWGFEYTPTHYIKTKWDETGIEQGRRLIITRNGEKFYDGLMTIHECIAYVLDNKLQEHPLDLNDRDFDKKMIGRKIWYRGEPAVISSYVKGQACVIIRPDGIERFTYPPEWIDDDDYVCDYEDPAELKVDIFSDRVFWWRRNDE